MARKRTSFDIHNFKFMVYFMLENGIIKNQFVGNVGSEQRAIEIARSFVPKSATLYKIEQL